MSYIRSNDLGALTMEQVGQRRGIDVSRLGVSNIRGCFTTTGQPISGSKDVVLQEVQNAAARSVQPNLSQEEVSLILAQRAVSQDKVKELLSHASATKDAWVDALEKLGPLRSCWVCGAERKAYNAAWWNAADMLRGLTPRSSEAFRSVDFLMIFAQNTGDAAALCDAKLKARAQYQEILDKIEPIVKQTNSEEAAIDAAKQGIIEKLLAIFQAFMAALQVLLEVIGAAFKGLVAAAGFIAGTIAPLMAANPRVFIYGGLGVVAAGAGLFGFIKYRQAKLALVGHI